MVLINRFAIVVLVLVGLGGCTGCQRTRLVTCEVCDHPPPASCVATDLRRVFNPAGVCVDAMCSYDFTDQRCPHGCDASTGACVPCENQCEAGAAQCTLAGERSCQVGTSGCFEWSANTPCADAFCADSRQCGVCQDQCPGAGFKECVGGNARVCEADEHGCLRWAAFTPCATGRCANPTQCETCMDGCPQEATTECSNGALRTCERAPSGCLQWSTPVQCPQQACADATQCSTCTDGCPADGATECTNGSTRTCARQGQCLAWSASSACPQGSCADATTCGCPNACPTENALQCAGTALQRCVRQPSGCLAWQPATSISVLADAYVRGAQYAAIAYGNDVPISVKNTTYSQEFMRKAYFAFDVGPLPNANYTATLRLEQDNAMQNGNLLLLFGITDNADWNPATLAEGAITYNNAPHNQTTTEYFTNEGQTNGSAVRQLGSFGSTTTGVKQVDVTPFVRWAKGLDSSYGRAPRDTDGIVTFMLRGNIFTNQGFTNIVSKESGSANRAQLVITCQP